MNNEIKPTWRLAWISWWRMSLISLGVSVVLRLILSLVGIAVIPSVIPW